MLEYDIPKKAIVTKTNKQTSTRAVQAKSSEAGTIQRARTNSKIRTKNDLKVSQSTIENQAVTPFLNSNQVKQNESFQYNAMKSQEKKIIQNKLNVDDEVIQKAEFPIEDRKEPIQMNKDNNTGLPNRLKAGVEKLSGIDMSDVRVHYNSDKPSQIGAFAYTQGTQIHVAPGQEKHLPHEAWHVVQQVQGRVQPTMQMKGIKVNNDVELEKEADEYGEKAIQASGLGLQGNLQAKTLRNSSYCQLKVVQRATDNKDKHQLFLQSKVPGRDPNMDIKYAEALACAIILDTHFFKVTEADKRPMFITALANGGFPIDKQPSFYEEKLYLYITSQNAVIPQNELSKITWGPMQVRTSLGVSYSVGSSVEIEFKLGGEAAGTPTNVNTPWITELNQRCDGTKSLYAMGHLLNADLGGPALDYNFVPLPARAGWYGANDANKLHSEMIEQIVKDKKSQLGGSVTRLWYKVTANYPRANRAAQIAQLQGVRNRMDDIKTELDSVNPNILSGQIQKNRKDVSPKIDSVAGLDIILRAVSSNNYWNRSWSTLQALLDSNIELWKLEDTLVPNSLTAQVQWVQDKMPGGYAIDIPISLPIIVTAPYNSSRKSGTKKEDPESHKSQFVDFIDKSVNLEEQSDELICQGFLADMNQYERDDMEELIYELENIPQYRAIAEDAKKSDEEREEAKEKIKTIEYERDMMVEVVPNFKRIVWVPNRLAIVCNFLKNKSVTKATKSAYLISGIQSGVNNYKVKKGKLNAVSDIKYSGRTPWDSPSAVSIVLVKDGQANGSSAGGDSSWMLNLEQRRVGKGDRTLYVRGHMLNRHLGGAGLDWNMVPLTGSAGWYGANNANAIHSAIIEELVKKLYYNLADPGKDTPGKVTYLRYSVEAIFGNHSRAQTAVVSQLTQVFEQYLDAKKRLIQDSYKTQSEDNTLFYFAEKHDTYFLQLLRNNSLDAASDLLLKDIYRINMDKYGKIGMNPLIDPVKTAIMVDFGFVRDAMTLLKIRRNQVWKSSIPSLDDKMEKEMLAQSAIKDSFNKPIGKDPDIEKAPILVELLNAVSSGRDYKEFSQNDLSDRMKENYKLWQEEDTLVPLRLNVSVNWEQDKTKFERTGFVPVVLPTDIRAPFDPRDDE